MQANSSNSSQSDTKPIASVTSNQSAKTLELSDSYIRMYYEHQYERMGKLEEQQLTLTNIVVAISIAAFTFGFGNIQALTPINAIGLPFLIILFNVFALGHLKRSSGFITVHQKRAIRILEQYAGELAQINNAIPWPKRPWLGGRFQIQRLLHILIIISCYALRAN